METKESFKVNVKSLDDRKMEYNLKRGTTVAEFKHKISESTSLPLDQIRLIYQARNLLDIQRIEEIVHDDDEVIHLIAKLNPSLPPRDQQQAPQPQLQPNPGVNLNALFGDIGSLFGGLGANPNQQAQGNFVSMTMPLNVNTGNQPNNNQEQIPNLGNLLSQTMQQVTAMLGNPQGTFQNTPDLNPQTPQIQSQNTSRNIIPENTSQNIVPENAVPQPPLQPQGNISSNTERNATFMPNNPRVNNIVSVNTQGINISIAEPNHDAHHFILNTEKLRTLTSTNEQLRNNNIDIPRRHETNNSATILGNYLKTVDLSLNNFLPSLQQASEILEAEQRLTDPAQRTQATQYIQSLGQSFKTYKEIFESLEFLTQFNFNDRPGRFTIGALDNNNRNLDPNDETRIQRDRQNIQNMMNMLSGGISANQSISELSRMAVVSDIDTDETASDCINILFEPLNIAELMALMSGNIGVIDVKHPNIKKAFQNMLIKYDNSREAIKKALLDSMTDEILLMIKNKGEGHINPNFDYEYIVKEINDKYIDEFSATLLKDYEQANMPTDLFSYKYISLLKKYIGHIAFELSQTMPNGIDDFKFILKEGFVEYINKRMEMPGFSLTSLFDNLVWKHVHEGYLQYQNDHRQVSERNLLLARLKDFKEIDESVEPETEYSEAYLKGKIFE